MDRGEKSLFEEVYSGESIVDIYRDVSEAVDGRMNPLMAEVPQDEHGFAKGTFTVSIVWTPDP